MTSHQPVRLCIGCRQTEESRKLVRVAIARNTDTRSVVVDYEHTIQGRGAWLHPNPECLTTALKRKAFHRAFKTAVDTEELAQLLTEWNVAKTPGKILTKAGQRSDGYPVSTR